jgi:Dock homology region 2
VCVQVNAGPMAYATAFLDPSKTSDYLEDDLEQLRDVFRYLHPTLHPLNKMIHELHSGTSWACARTRCS